MADKAKLEMDKEAWRAGVAAGIAGDKHCPYPETSPVAWAWSSGWIEGDAKRQQRDQPTA